MECATPRFAIPKGVTRCSICGANCVAQRWSGVIGRCVASNGLESPGFRRPSRDVDRDVRHRIIPDIPGDNGCPHLVGNCRVQRIRCQHGSSKQGEIPAINARAEGGSTRNGSHRERVEKSIPDGLLAESLASVEPHQLHGTDP